MRRLFLFFILLSMMFPCAFAEETTTRPKNEDPTVTNSSTAEGQSFDDAKPTHNGPTIKTLAFETRLGWEGERLDGEAIHDATGFKGQYFNLRIDGQIVKGLDFSYRQRLSKQTSQTFWDATDWIHLDWTINPHWQLSAGKQVVAIGGYEYDRAPIDLYYCSEFWNQIVCYQLGISATYKPNTRDALTLQVCNSPFRAWAGNNTYGINLLWSGKHGWWESLWSINAAQRTRDSWMNYIALGNRFHIGSHMHLDVDLMNRAASHQTFLFKDFSVMSELSAQVHPTTRIYAKYTYDQNTSGTTADLLVTDGTKLHMMAAGAEVAPLPQKYRDMLRIFAAAGYYWGTNTNPAAANQDRQLMVEAGVKFRLNLIDAIAPVIEKIRRK